MKRTNRRRWPRSILALSTGLAVATAAGAPTASADPPPAPTITALRIVIQTGDDDLRTDSSAVARLWFVDASGRRRNAGMDLNGRQAWGNWSTNTRDMPVPPGLTLADLDRFEIEFTSGQPDVFHTGDNWNMQSIEVYAVLDDDEGTTVLVTSDAGDPLHRFQSDRERLWFQDL